MSVDRIASGPAATSVSGPAIQPDPKDGDDPGAGAVPLSAEALERAFLGDPAILESFVRVLRQALPDGTTIILRGSAIAGHSYETDAPFDADGPGTSDLDVVVVGEGVVDLWNDDARLLGGVNTLPLSDSAPCAAPLLDLARREAQDLVRRPVSIQGMAKWFLDLRGVVQGTPYAVLSSDA
jgi:hypothetical protein